MADKFDHNLSPGYQGNMVSSKTSLHGVTPFLTRVYKTDDLITEDFYNGIGTPIGDDIPIVFGRVMLTGNVVSAGALRSDLDPSQVKQVVQFVTSEGPTKGVAGVGDEKMKNILINGVPVMNESKVITNKEFGWKEVAGIATSAAVLASVPYIKKFLGIDPETGTTIPDEVKSILKGAATKTSLDKIEGLGVDATGKFNDVWAWDDVAQKYANRPFPDVLKESGVGVTDLLVKYNGALVRTDVRTINFIGTGAVVSDVGGDGKQVNVTIAGGTGGGGTTPPGDTTPTPTSCAVNFQILTPKKGQKQTYYLKRNGVLMCAYYDEKGTATASEIAAKFSGSYDASGVYIDPKTVNKNGAKTSYFKVEASGPNISISADASCKPCDFGTWGMTRALSSTVANSCAIRKPTLSV